MLLTTIIGLFFGVWSSIFLIDYYLKAFNIKSYVNFAERFGLTVSFLQLRFYFYKFDENVLSDRIISSWLTTRINDFLKSSKFSSLWFICGSLLSLLLLLFMVAYLSKIFIDHLHLWCILIHNSFEKQKQFYSMFNHQNATTTVAADLPSTRSYYREAAILPVIPGLNMPLWHIPIFIMVYLISGMLHELGHIFASIHSNVSVNGFGLFFIALYPGAFTEIDSDALKHSTSAQKMRIFSAGIWHNLVLTLISYILFISLPYLLSPLYDHNNGVLIMDVSKESGLNGGSGLHKGDVLNEINGCKVMNINDWYKCIELLRNKPFSGYCVPYNDVSPYITNKVKLLNDVELECCGENLSQSDDIPSSSHVCFQFRRTDLSNVSKALSSSSKYKNTESLKFENILNGGEQMQYACLAARFVTEHQQCDELSTCETNGSLCVYPSLFNETSLLRLLTIYSSKPILFIGSIYELVYYVQISDFVPRLFFLPTRFPLIAEIFLKYMITFSLAMALLNAVPCYGLDGHFIASTVVDYLFYKYSSSQRRRIESVIIYYGTFILVTNILVALVQFVIVYFK